MGKIKIGCALLMALIFSAPLLGHAVEKDKYNLYGEYGPQLKSVPFVIRYKYQQDTNKKWVDASVSERKSFLTDWHNGVSQRQAKASAEAQATAKIQSEAEKAKKAVAKVAMDKVRAKERQQNEEARAKATRDREFNRRVSESKRRMAALRRKQR